MLYLQLHVICRLTFGSSVVASSGTGLSVLGVVDSPSVAMDADLSISSTERHKQRGNYLFIFKSVTVVRPVPITDIVLASYRLPY